MLFWTKEEYLKFAEAISVSRFVRNTVDSLTTIRELKDKGVECYSKKETIWTFDGKGELISPSCPH